MASAAAREAEAAARWAERLLALRLPACRPVQIRTWLGLRTETLAKAAAADSAAVAVRVDATRRTEALVGLRAALDERDKGEAALAPVLARAEARLASSEALSSAFRLLKERLKTAEETVHTLTRRIAMARRVSDEHRTAWAAALEEAGMTLPLAEAEIQLDLIERLRAAEEAVASLQRRIETIRADGEHFETRVTELAVTLGEPARQRSAAERVDDLRSRLARANSDAQAYHALTQEADRHTADMRSAQAAIAAADAQLVPAKALTGAADAGALTNALAASRHLRSLQEQIAEQEREITAAGELRLLLAACEAEDDETMAARADRIETELSEVTEALSNAAEAAGAARTTLKALDRGLGAADAAADAQAARSEMEAQAEAYLRQRTQCVILRWAIDRYRERRQNPLLDRAGELFRTLTLGNYAGLRIDPDSGDRLLGLCADGATLLDVNGMSDGTVDQLYLALRLASVEQATGTGVRLPFLADDLFINFDDERARAGFQVLGELARYTQVLFFTHHRHLLPVAEAALGADVVTVCELNNLSYPNPVLNVRWDTAYDQKIGIAAASDGNTHYVENGVGTIQRRGNTWPTKYGGLTDANCLGTPNAWPQLSFWSPPPQLPQHKRTLLPAVLRSSMATRLRSGASASGFTGSMLPRVGSGAWT